LISKWEAEDTSSFVVLWAAMYLHQRKWKVVNVGCEVCVLVVGTP
jgi:hypothetical protein